MTGEIEEIGRFYKPPFRLVEPAGDEAAMIVDANGESVAMMMWPGHPPEETEAAEQETYTVGRTFASPPEAADEITRLKALIDELVKGLKPFAEPHAMGDQYVQFAPRLIEHARSLIARARSSGKAGSDA